jgi:FkbM family methyltransferase
MTFLMKPYQSPLKKQIIQKQIIQKEIIQKEIIQNQMQFNEWQINEKEMNEDSLELHKEKKSIIPLSIYQCWHSDILPNSVEESINSIKVNNPEFEHHLFNESQCREFIKLNFDSDVLYAYDSLIPHAFKVDLWRYCVLYINGGIYLDVKYMPISNFKFINLTDNEYFCSDLKYCGIYNAIIITKPNNALLLKVIQNIVQNVKNSFYGKNGLEVSGPLLIQRLYSEMNYSQPLLKHQFFDTNDKRLYFICYKKLPILQIHLNYRNEQKKIDLHWDTYWKNKNVYLKKYPILNYNNNEIYYFSVYENCIISNVIKKGIIWEKYMHNVFEKYITKKSVVIEGGCHIGTHTLKLASLSQTVYAFEPLDSSNKLLDYNLRTNNITNVILSSCGLSDKKGETKYGWISDGNPGSAGLDNNPMGIPDNLKTSKDIIVQLTSIDELNLDKLDFIKLDVEGYEPLVINGGMNTIKKYKPIITLECWSSHKGTKSIEYTTNTFEELINVGYEIIQIDSESADFLFLPTN